MRREVVAFGLTSSKPQRVQDALSSLESTPRIGHSVPRYRGLRGESQKARFLGDLSRDEEGRKTRLGLGF